MDTHAELPMQRTDILNLLKEIVARQGRSTEFGEDAELAGVGFRSLDFSELAVRVEMAAGISLAFDAMPLRAVRTVADILDFFAAASVKK